MSITSEQFRRVLGHLPTGVTVVTAYGAGGLTGMAANSVTSLSLKPPMILLCPARSSATWPEIRQVGSFCVNVMAGHHEEITRRFARKGVDRFDGVRWSDGPCGPVLDQAVAWIACRIRDEHDGGDHTIVVADVHAIEADAEAQPLVFFRGHYSTLGARAEA
jgi:flavin reductase (DIM6/NTAB) family NADH-FMN oxidoreductase RutF